MGLRKIKSLVTGEKLIYQLHLRANKEPFGAYEVVVEKNDDVLLVLKFGQHTLVFFKDDFDNMGICTTHYTITKFYYPNE